VPPGINASSSLSTRYTPLVCGRAPLAGRIVLFECVRCFLAECGCLHSLRGHSSEFRHCCPSPDQFERFLRSQVLLAVSRRADAIWRCWRPTSIVRLFSKQRRFLLGDLASSIFHFSRVWAADQRRRTHPRGINRHGRR
jgi:hypothetical protein